jgi:predicted metal-dependent HD superfamily phosphohydrolase
MSAKYATSFLASIDFPGNKIEKVDRLIQLTQHPSEPVSNDEKLLIDIDLSILGATKEKYDRYESQIKKEYAYVPNFMYAIGRRKLLNSFLNTKSIYQTDYFQKKFEISATQNILRAIQQL